MVARSNNIKSAASGRKKQPKPSVDNEDIDEQLQSDIASFVKQLGFGSNGVADGGFDDVDFQPLNARKKLGSAQEDEGMKPTKASRRQEQAASDKHPSASSRRQLAAPATPSPARGIQDAQAPQPSPSTAPASLLPKDASPIWHEAIAQLPPLPTASTTPAGITPLAIDALRRHAETLLECEAQAFAWQLNHGRRGDLRWLQQARKSGTTQDRIAAMTVLVNENVFGNVQALDALLQLANKRGSGKQVVGTALDALQELFTGVLLPDRKLRFFEQQALGGLPTSGKVREQYLLAYAMEDAIKRRYALYISALEACSKDTLTWLKEKATKALANLLQVKPEGEARILACLVNKLGDPDRKVASKVCFLLSELLNVHPAMKVVVVREVEFFMFRPGLSERARYYGIVFLNQLALSHRESEGGAALAKKLMHVYFTLFKLLLTGHIGYAAEADKKRQEKKGEQSRKKKGTNRSHKGGQRKGGKVKGGHGKGDKEKQGAVEEGGHEEGKGEKAQVTAMDSRMLSGILTGVRRAFPYVQPEDVEPLVEVHADTLFRIVHGPNLSVSVQSLLLLHTLINNQVSISDRFYRSLYALLLAPELPTSSKVAPMFLSLLFKSIKADHSPQRIAAMTKRLMQVAVGAPAHFAAGALLIVSELIKVHPVLAHALTHVPAAALGANDDDDVERFHDVDDDEEEDGDGDGRAQHAKHNGEKSTPASDDNESGDDEEHGDDESDDNEKKDDDNEKQKGQQKVNKGGGHEGLSVHGGQRKGGQRKGGNAEYDIHKREPLYANAAHAGLWEMCACMQHYHPSVSAWGRTLLAGMPIEYTGDPLKDMSLASFLDKFMLKKPKSRQEVRGSSLMQPLPRPNQHAAAPGWVGSEAFAALAEDEVSPDALFFHKYYGLTAVQRKQAAKRSARDALNDEHDGGADSDDDAAVDDFLAEEEDAGEEGISADPDAKGYDYNTLWKAMQEDDGEDAREDDGEDGAWEEDTDEEEEEEEIGGDGEDEDEGEDDDEEDIPEDINPFALASESSGEDDNDVDSEDDDQEEEEECDIGDSEDDGGDTSEEEGEWVMAAHLDAPDTTKRRGVEKRETQENKRETRKDKKHKGMHGKEEDGGGVGGHGVGKARKRAASDDDDDNDNDDVLDDEEEDDMDDSSDEEGWRAVMGGEQGWESDEGEQGHGGGEGDVFAAAEEYDDVIMADMSGQDIDGIPSSSKGHAALASSPQQGNKEKGNKGARGSVKGRKTAGKGGRNEKQAGESKKQASKTGLRGKKGEGKRKDKGTKEAQRKKRKH